MTEPWADRLLTTREAAVYLRVHPSTLKRWKAVPYATVGTRGDRRYRQSDLDAYLRRAE